MYSGRVMTTERTAVMQLVKDLKARAAGPSYGARADVRFETSVGMDLCVSFANERTARRFCAGAMRRGAFSVSAQSAGERTIVDVRF